MYSAILPTILALSAFFLPTLSSPTPGYPKGPNSGVGQAAGTPSGLSLTLYTEKGGCTGDSVATSGIYGTDINIVVYSYRLNNRDLAAGEAIDFYAQDNGQKLIVSDGGGHKGCHTFENGRVMERYNFWKP